MKQTVFIVLTLAASATFAEKLPIERYQSIIERQMFGPLPPGFDPSKSPNEVQKLSSAEARQLTQEQEKLQSSIHFSVINVDADGVTAVGFTDNSDPKAPVHYYLRVGERRNGWEVKEADAAKATMTIAKDDIEVSLALGGDSAKDGGTSRSGSGAGGGASAANARASLFGMRGGLRGGTMRDRRMLRQKEAQEAAAKRQEEQAAKEAERQALAEAEKQQRDAERAEQQQQLLMIQEELKKVRETKAAAAQDESGESGDANDEAQ